MIDEGTTSALILSDKSSGSSILQEELLKHPLVRGLEKTPHQERETLYWNKAAALLDLAQEPIRHSKVLPMARGRARSELIRLCTDNLEAFDAPADDRNLVFSGWRALAHAHRPVFLEKSPHHLHYRSALDLILEADAFLSDINFRYVGLIRAPMDTLYSMWKRWGLPPEETQHDWVRAYRNLLDFRSRAPDRTIVIKYEDLVQGASVMKEACGFLGLDWSPEMGASLSSAAVGAAQADRSFGFRPDDTVIRLAQEFGYEAPSQRSSRTIWLMRRGIGTVARRLRHQAGKTLRGVTAANRKL